MLDTTFPHDKPQMLYWNVQSEMDGEATVEITYFTSGISWSADYLCIANPAETEMGFEGFVRVSNNSGEEYENAQVRLVVGQDQPGARRSPSWPASRRSRSPSWSKASERSSRQALSGRRWTRRMPRGRGRPASRKPAEPKEIIKEGLSEYFIYTIEGTETIPNGWSKRMRSFEGQTVPFKIQYRYRPAGIRRPARADVSADQRQGIEAGHHAAAGRHGPRLPRERPRRPVASWSPSRSSTSPSATRSS